MSSTQAISREVLVRQVELGFDELAVFAFDSQSNVEIVRRLMALQQQVRQLYEVPPAPPPCGACAARESFEADRKARGNVETSWPPAGEKWG